jgi:hypothetical protein
MRRYQKKMALPNLERLGIHDEVGAAAKEILRLVADDGMTFQ